MKTHPRWVVIALSMALVLSVGLSSATAQQPLTEVTYIFPAPFFLPTFSFYGVAQAKGYFRDEGLIVKPVVGRGGVDAAKQVGAGNAQFGQGLGEGPIILRPQGVPIKVIAVLGPAGLHFIMADKKKGITKIADLKGRTLGVMSYADTSYFVWLAALASAGLTKEDVNIQAVGPGGMAPALVSGKVDALLGVLQYGIDAEEAGVEVLWIPTNDFFPGTAQGIFTSDKMIRENPDLVRRFTRAVLRGMVHVIKDPADAARIWAETVPQWKGKEAYLTKVFTRYAQGVYGGQRVPGMIDADRLATLQDYYVSKGIVKEKVPLADLYSNAFLK